MDIEEAKKYCKQIKDKDLWKIGYVYGTEAIDAVLSELEKKDTEIIEAKEANRQLSLELEKKEAIINEMSKFIANLKLSWFKKEDSGEFLGKYRFYNQEEWIEYFTNKVEREGK